MRNQTTGTVLKGGVRGRSASNRPTVRFNKLSPRKDRPATGNEMPVSSFQADEVFARIEEIKKVWAQGAGNSIALARVVWDARRRLPHGQWEQVLKLLPFSKRKANMLATVGKGFNWVNGQMIAQIPAGWSILYQLAQLDRATFERLLQEGIIHLELRLQEAKELLARFKGRRRKPASQSTGVKRRLQCFRDYVRRTLKEWKPEERELAKTELTRVLELIVAGGRDRFERKLGEVRVGPSHRRILITHRAATLPTPAT